MAITGLNATETFRVASRQDENYDADPDKAAEAGATIFVYKVLPRSIMAKLQDDSQVAEVSLSSDKQTIHNKNATRALKAFEFGITDILNMKDPRDPDGEKDIQVKFSQKAEGLKTFQVLHEDILASIPQAIITEIGGRILASNQFSEAEAKKLDGQSLALLSTGTLDASPAQETSKKTGGAKRRRKTREAK